MHPRYVSWAQQLHTNPVSGSLFFNPTALEPECALASSLKASVAAEASHAFARGASVDVLPLEALHASDASAMEASSVSHVSHWLRCPGDEASQTLWMEVSREWAKATTRYTGSTSREVHPGGEWAWLGAAWQR